MLRVGCPEAGGGGGNPSTHMRACVPGETATTTAPRQPSTTTPPSTSPPRPALVLPGMSGMLVADLAALASETKRRQPDVRHACDAALASLRSEYDAALARSAADPSPDPLANLLLRPIVLACAIKSPKVLTLGIALLQRAVAMHVVSDAALPAVLQLLPSLAQRSADVDAQLKLLQTIGSLITTYPQIHDAPLADLLRICFAYQESAKVALVSSTAAATLRSAIMTLLDKVIDEDARLDSIKGGGEEGV